MSYDLVLKVYGARLEVDRDAVHTALLAQPDTATCELTQLDDEFGPDSSNLAEAFRERELSRLEFVWFSLLHGRLPLVSSLGALGMGIGGLLQLRDGRPEKGKRLAIAGVCLGVFNVLVQTFWLLNMLFVRG